MLARESLAVLTDLAVFQGVVLAGISCDVAGSSTVSCRKTVHQSSRALEEEQCGPVVQYSNLQATPCCTPVPTSCSRVTKAKEARSLRHNISSGRRYPAAYPKTEASIQGERLKHSHLLLLYDSVRALRPVIVPGVCYVQASLRNGELGDAGVG